jgi:ABC-type transport system substrate-binding protein
MVRLNTTLSSTTHQEKTRPSTPWLQPRCEQRPDWQLCCEFLQAAWDEIGVKFTFKVVANAVLEEDQTAGYAPALLSDV